MRPSLRASGLETYLWCSSKGINVGGPVKQKVGPGEATNFHEEDIEGLSRIYDLAENRASYRI